MFLQKLNHVGQSSASHRCHPPLSRCPIILTGLMMLAILATPTTGQVAGAVLDASTLTPIGGALVTLRATTQQGATAADGSYILQGVSGTNLVVVAAKKGYYNAPMGVTAPGAATGRRRRLCPVESSGSHQLPGVVLLERAHPHPAALIARPTARPGITSPLEAPFAPDSFDAIERIRRRSLSYVEEFVIERRTKMA